MNLFGKISRLLSERPLFHAACVFGGFLLFYTVFFAPVLFSEQLLAFGDGINYFLPAYYAPTKIWTTSLFAGYPIAADPQNMTWYPPALLLSWMPGSWNFFVMLAYVLAASFAYCYVYVLTNSRLAGIAAGLAYSMSGFMMAHLTMIGMVHAAAWIPLLLCALEKLRHQITRSWLAIGVLAFVCCFLGGHPQISIYGIGLGVYYMLFLGWHAPIGRWKYYRHAVGMIAIGIGICAIQLLPAAELSRLSLRSELTQGAFLAGSVWPRQAQHYIFPFLFGTGISSYPYTMPYWGEANAVDIAGYVGILPLILTAVGVSTNHRRGIVRFWLVVAIVAFLLTFGRYFFLARLMYYVPIYNAFRIPARHSIQLAMAINVLAGFGVAAIQQRKVSKRAFWGVIVGSILVMLFALSDLVLNPTIYQLRSNNFGLTELTFRPWANAAVGVPMVIFTAGIAALLLWRFWPRPIGAVLVLLTVLTLDLASFGFWFHDWARIAPQAAVLNPGPTTQKYRQLLSESQQRMLIGSGSSSHLVPDAQNPIFTNVNRLWELPSAGGYSPLMVARLSEMIQMRFDGMLEEAATYDQNRGLDLMSVQYLLAQNGLQGTSLFSDFPANVTRIAQSYSQPNQLWSSDADLNLTFGISATEPLQQSVKIDLSNLQIPDKTTDIALVTTLRNAVSVPNNTAVMNVQVTDDQGFVETQPVLTGRDTAEQTYDCADIQPQMQHERAEVFRTVPIERPGMGRCQSNSYKSIIQLSQPRGLKQILLQSTGVPAEISVQQISLLNSENQSIFPIDATTKQGMTTKWEVVERFPGGVMYENKQALPRAWVVPAVAELEPAKIIETIRTSKLPSGAVYQPEKLALVETADRALAPLIDQRDQDNWQGTAAVLEVTDNRVEVQTDATLPALLVLSDVNYPGWQAWVDNQPTKIFQTNYVQRGVKIPAGNHRVRFEFHPFSFNLGLGITAASTVGGLYWLIRLKPIKSS